MTLQDQITQYLDHIEDFAYVDAILKSAPLENIYETIAELLRSGQLEPVWTTSVFLRDVVLSAPPEIAEPFREKLHTSQIREALHDNLFAPNHFIRRNAFYNCGKLGFKESIGVLSKTFEYYLESDPLLLPDLLFELHWLGDTQEWIYFKQMAECPSYLTRWAALATRPVAHVNIPQNAEDLRHTELQKKYLEQLVQDTHPRVRAEADYKLREFHFYQTRFPSKADQKKARKELEKHLPNLAFFTLEVQFHNTMARNQKTDYALSELEMFVDHVAG
jgi:hypothetical protein